jgi:hypothetical protein
MKDMSYLIESALEKAEVVLAAKTITDAIQKMAEAAAKMEADDVMPLNDPIREHFGPEAAAAFSEAVTGKVRELTKILGETKNAISDEIARMQGELSGEPQNDLATMDDGAEIGDGAADDGQSDLSADIPQDDATAPAMDVPGDAPAAPADAAPAPADDMPKFDADATGSLSKAAGRARKESAEPKGRMLESVNPDRIVAQEYAGMIREGKSALEAATSLTESYGLSINDLVEIVTAYKK